ncbi:hypothetical protein [Streptomyces zingiberis]|uniref:Uncharacterized protein n=1 Tax=Streptomyces zingiberis TaxID=2053010 RepID=A0ABX1BPH1_9ACTN|nr:hypothetical protein [Streptomyces zingiberis]NJP99638.1 hypothetical protein [Streptomyces zingiberis]
MELCSCAAVNGVRYDMFEVRSAPVTARREKKTVPSDAGPGRHRGPAAREDAEGPGRGRHRRPSPGREV